MTILHKWPLCLSTATEHSTWGRNAAIFDFNFTFLISWLIFMMGNRDGLYDLIISVITVRQTVNNRMREFRVLFFHSNAIQRNYANGTKITHRTTRDEKIYGFECTESNLRSVCPLLHRWRIRCMQWPLPFSNRTSFQVCIRSSSLRLRFDCRFPSANSSPGFVSIAPHRCTERCCTTKRKTLFQCARANGWNNRRQNER